MGMFSGVIICCNGIGDKSVTLGNQNNMSGVRGSPWDGLDRKIVLEKIGIPDSNMEKMTIFLSPQCCHVRFIRVSGDNEGPLSCLHDASGGIWGHFEKS